MDMNPAAMRAMAALLEKRTGQQLSAARNWRLELALNPLMQERGLQSLDAVARLAASGDDPALSDAVVEALLNNETSFFRDAAAFAALADTALPALAARTGAGRALRIWCAGCSTGQEAYSVAMACAARLPGQAIEIVASDISRASIARAHAGVYPHMEIQRGLPIRQMIEWFDPLDDGAWRAKPALRARVRFQARNVLAPPPMIGGFDVVLCRNVLLYFDCDRRLAAFGRLADAIAPDGLLMLGAGETVIGQTDRFVPHETVRGLYRPAADAVSADASGAMRGAA